MTVLLGGARSGKSTVAVRLAAASGLPVTVVATAQPLDTDMAERIERHRSERPDFWHTVEEPLELGRAIRDAAGVVIVDCLTVWVANLLESGLDEPGIVERAREAAGAAARREDPTIVVTNEVGSGVVPALDVARRYRDALGRVNQEFTDRAARSLLLVAGRIVPTLALSEALPELGAR